MELSISHPALLTVADGAAQSFFGGAQAWYSTDWSRKAGCGPTCAANILAYLALTRPALSPLYGYQNRSRSDFTRHMEEVYPFLTPGSMGLNRVELFSEGVLSFARARGLLLEPHVFKVSGRMAGSRPKVSALADFVRAGLAADCPVGFLNLSRGREKNLQSWHWVTIVAAELEENKLLVTVSDEGRRLRLNLRLWYLTTPMRGGLAYFTEPSPPDSALGAENAKNA